MKTIDELLRLSEKVSNANTILIGIRKEIKQEVEALENKYAKMYDLAADKLADAEAELTKAIEESRELYIEPRTQTYFNVKAGLQKEHDSYEIEDMDKSVKLIKEKMPEHADTLIKVTETVIIEPLKNFKPEELKQVGIDFVRGEDKVTISIVKPKVAKEITNSLKKSPIKKAL
ncbi:MAG: hypothetical protein K1X86_15610 [Ignavibacteria bacterium]|nr:hypothetical protein [Ignavibacteria bacterium]